MANFEDIPYPDKSKLKYLGDHGDWLIPMDYYKDEDGRLYIHDVENHHWSREIVSTNIRTPQELRNLLARVSPHAKVLIENNISISLPELIRLSALHCFSKSLEGEDVEIIRNFLNRMEETGAIIYDE